MEKMKSKKEWQTPTHIKYGDVAEITKKSAGDFDGVGMNPPGQAKKSPGAS